MISIIEIIISNIQQCFSFFIHIDAYIMLLLAKYGSWCYLLVAIIILCETGLIITPFLPGDSLLFTLGTITAQSDTSLNIFILFIILFLASIIGNQINYIFGRFIGPRILAYNKIRFINKQYLIKAHVFYNLHGGKTIIFARFLPIIRTFAPFIAGISKMNFKQFTIYNIISAILWIGILLGMGYFLGSSALIKEHFSVVIYGIIIISILPSSLAMLAQRKNVRN